MRFKDRLPASPSKKGFSLVELLGVIVIIVILVTLGAAAMKDTSGPTLTTAGAMTVDLINEARQIAIARNTKTMFVVREDAGGKGRHMTILTYSPETTANEGWTQMEKWYSLPDGIIIEPNPSGIIDAYGAPLLEDLPTGVTVRAKSPSNFKSAIFLPNGRPLVKDDRARLMSILQKTPNAINQYNIIVNATTGNPFVRRP